MRSIRNWVMGVMFAAVFFTLPSVEASVIISEILADPAMGLEGDANNDGIRSGKDDEFVEILNFSDASVDISGWFLTDKVSTRHIFPMDTILSPYAFFVVFGGGSPVLPDVNWQVSSTGSLSLNNDGDTVSLFNAGHELVDRVVYGRIGGQDQSITLFPEWTATEFVLHSSLPEAQGALFSPGTSANLQQISFGEEEPPIQAAVPELPALVYFASGWGALLLKKK